MTTPTDREREQAREIAEKIGHEWYVADVLDETETQAATLKRIAEPIILKALADAREEGRREEREDCVEVARRAGMRAKVVSPSAVRVCDEIAAAIRGRSE